MGKDKKAKSSNIRGDTTDISINSSKKKNIKQIPVSSEEESAEDEESYYSEDIPDEDYSTRILAFYKHYEPNKIKNVSALCKKYKGKESELLAALVMKYGPEPHNLVADKVKPVVKQSRGFNPLKDKLA